MTCADLSKKVNERPFSQSLSAVGLTHLAPVHDHVWLPCSLVSRASRPGRREMPFQRSLLLVQLQPRWLQPLSAALPILAPHQAPQLVSVRRPRAPPHHSAVEPILSVSARFGLTGSCCNTTALLISQIDWVVMLNVPCSDLTRGSVHPECPVVTSQGGMSTQT